MTREEYKDLLVRQIFEAREDLDATSSRNWEDSWDCNSQEDDEDRDDLHRQANRCRLKLNEILGR